jgi:hypothetical protein
MPVNIDDHTCARRHSCSRTSRTGSQTEGQLNYLSFSVILLVSSIRMIAQKYHDAAVTDDRHVA